MILVILMINRGSKVVESRLKMVKGDWIPCFDLDDAALHGAVSAYRLDQMRQISSK